MPNGPYRGVENLDRIVQQETWLERDRLMIDQLKSLGIEKGKPFAPDAATKQALDAGIREAQAYLVAAYDAGFPAFYEGTHWMFPAKPELMKAAQSGYTEPDSYPVDVAAWRTPMRTSGSSDWLQVSSI